MELPILLYSIYGMKNRVGNVGHSAHLGGAIGGFAFTLTIISSSSQRKFINDYFSLLTYLISNSLWKKTKRIKKSLINR